ncbi:hypothetical protein VC1_45 [Vibrio phage Vc1]|uniref:Uncharacterized protein n=1 Tax=Vibrio phage Vc1 TaxID=1480731 RepID=A0A9X9SEE2_9CAUD|nr:hypothetical protein KMB90_gp45 [Vibrio virus 2019VC1]
MGYRVEAIGCVQGCDLLTCQGSLSSLSNLKPRNAKELQLFKVLIDGVTVTVTVRDDHFIIGALDKLRKVKSLPAEIVEAMQSAR